MPEYLSFEDVVSQLGLSEDEVKRLVSEGELRAFRDEDRMKFRKEDVDSLAARGGGGGGEEGTILDLDSAVDFESGELPAASDTAVPSVDFGEGSDASSEPAEDLDASMEPAPIDTTGVPESDFGDSEGTIIEPPAEGEAGDTTGVTQEMVFDDSDDLKVQKEDSSSVGAAESDETFAEDSSSHAADQELVDAPEEGAESAAVEEEAEAPAAHRAARAAAPAAPAVPGHHPVMTVCLFLCSAAMWILGSLLVDLVRVAMSESPASPAGLNRSVIKLFAGDVDKSTK
ncbi:MAG: helix-turn-helix domain-containing protein [Planctomycetota bacterium]